MSAFTVAGVEHAYVPHYMPSSARGRADNYWPTCSCGWHGDTSHYDGAIALFNAHLDEARAGERSAA